MKKFLILSFAAAAAFACLSADAQVKMKYSPDPVFDQNRISALRNGAPSKLAADSDIFAHVGVQALRRHSRRQGGL